MMEDSDGKVWQQQGVPRHGCGSEVERKGFVYILPLGTAEEQNHVRTGRLTSQISSGFILGALAR